LFEKLYKSGDIEKFYTNSYTGLMLQPLDMFPGIEIDTATLIMKRLIDELVSFYNHKCSEKQAKHTESSAQPLTKREEYGLEYIGRYTCWKLSKKLRNSKHWSENRTQMALSFLCATTSLNEQEECNVMINEINRGSLWCPFV